MVDLSDILIDDLVDELENRNIYIAESHQAVLRDCDDVDLIDEIESRGYSVNMGFKQTENVDIFELYEMKRINSKNFDAVFAEYIWNNCGRIL